MIDLILAACIVTIGLFVLRLHRQRTHKCSMVFLFNVESRRARFGVYQCSQCHRVDLGSSGSRDP